MIESGKGGICLLCGGIDGKCRSGFKDSGIEFDCFYVNKKLTINVSMKDVKSIQGQWYEIMGYLINQAPEGTILVKEPSKEFNTISIKDIGAHIPTTAGKWDNLLRIFYTTRRLSFDEQEFTDVSPHMAYCLDRWELRGMVTALEEMGYIKIDRKLEENGLFGFEHLFGRLTAKGVLRAERMLSNKKSVNVFIALKFNTEYSDTINEAVKKGCTDLNLSARSIDAVDYIGDINDRIISEINKSKFVVADYTENNCGVYYESGYARGRNIIVIELCNKEWFEKKNKDGHKVNFLHFDVEHRNMILWDNKEDLTAKIKDRLEVLLQN